MHRLLVAVVTTFICLAVKMPNKDGFIDYSGK